MGIKNVVKKIGGKAGDKVAGLSALSPAQVENVQLLREKYLLEMPNPNDPTAREQTERLMAASSVEIFNAYLPQIKDLYLPLQNEAEYGKSFDDGHNIRYINITKWVTDKKENNLEKLVNVYAVLSNEDCNIALVFDRKQSKTNVYLAVVNSKNATSSTEVDNYKDQIVEAIRGNFPGAEWADEDGAGVLPCFRDDKNYSVSMASNIPTEKSEKFISQTIEKLIDGIIPDSNKKEYTIILLATPILDVEDRKLKLGEFYSGLKPYASWQTSFQRTENESFSSSATVGVNVGASAGIQNGTNSAVTDTDSTTENESSTNTESNSDSSSKTTSTAENSSSAHSDGTNTTTTHTEGTQESKGTNGSITASQFASASATAGGGILPAGATVTAGGGLSETVGTSYSHGWNTSNAQALGKTAQDTITKGLTNTVGQTIGKTTGTAVANTLGKAVTTAMAKTSGVSKAVNLGGNIGANFARSSTTTAMLGKNEGITQSFTNYNVEHALELLTEQMKRYEQSTALGMWDFAAYVLSEDANVASNVAHSYLALTLGEESYMSKSAINTWRGNVEDEAGQAKEISNYIKMLRHPVFGLNPAVVGKVEDGVVQVEVDEETEFIVYPPIVTATTCLSGKELAYSLNFPQKSIAGLPVIECVEFGRNVITYDEQDSKEDEIKLGSIFHMNHPEKNTVSLSKKSLASHTFITGSTGSGKSNTVYHMLEKARKKGVNFLVVEPAKGEYKNVFGGRKDVSVYGTNPLISPLLRINPFSFPKNIHVLEHLDRLVEIFNVCWPMYAAMPAVLKSAIEQSYVDSGWDLVKSTNKYGEDLYPSFEDVARNVKEKIDSSEYDAENKGAYKGSLLTRLESLCNGINGMIFVADEIADSKLFDENVIVDLSRVGSSETKSLIMGMMVLKLQEYRLSNADSMNSELKHLTVLEEAHNLLRRTSSDQSAEGNNLLGKSVEMLSNAIAEMRTYGEGFIIADQAPGLMDMSVIRNTNTKIILRLPDQADRELVGRAANLNEDQITEIAKLPCGVAAVYQNEWIQPVLCKVDLFNVPEEPYKYIPSDDDVVPSREHIEKSLLDCIMDKELCRKGNKADLRALKSRIIRSKLETHVKRDFMDYLTDEGEDALEKLRKLIFDFMSAEEAILEAKQCNDIVEWSRKVVENLNPTPKEYSKKQIDIALGLILYEQSLRDSAYGSVFCKFTEMYKNEGGVF
ncbi:helicase HerA domain-containing protein [Pseudobutyrivibrio ruminis]|uniref:helicase HerA domain-containing protein n=1 Tax=Pseudobutyrivibrio ruminis TaxID=46206 RepID=UPI00051AD857|nr:DUF87 domain-containing protein [Pseudobutyrivibrio ruminis]